ncbi:MAG: murein biosynthesis integral membrane protein MurJ [Planctomycetes bacterium]|nr:murein biosynthesis integral membrane protein MurJ [Planctomycetota bacterium]
MIRGFRQIVSFTVFSRILGMLRDMSFAYFLGAGGVMDGWAIAFKIPNLARRLFGEGAAASSLIPTYSEQLEKDPERAKKLANTVISVVFVILCGIVLLGELIIWLYYKFFTVYPSTELKLALSAVMLPYMILICTVAIIAGILNVHRHFAAPAAAPIVLNIFIIGSLCFSGWVLSMRPGRQVFVVAVAVIVAGAVQLLMQLLPLAARGLYIRPCWDVRSQAFRKIMFLMGPMILGLTATQINTLADDFIALWFSGSAEKGEFFMLFGSQIKYPLWEGAVSQLFFSQRLYQFPLGVFGISLATAIFPVMSTEAAKKDFDSLCATIARGFRCAVFIAVPATVGLMLVAKPLTAAIFQRGRFTAGDTSLTSGVLLCYALGLTGFFAQQIVTRAFYSMHDSKLPARTALLAVIVNLILNLGMIWFMGAAGLALSTAICSYLQVIILVFALRKKLGAAVLSGLIPALLKTALNAFIMAIIIVTVLKITENLSDVAKLAAAVPAGGIVYWAGARALKIEMLSIFTGKKV